jgi:nucleotide-binding universal stress UspA family protein
MNDVVSPTAFRHVVVALDEAGRSQEAVRAAVSLCERLGSRLDVVHVVAVPAVLRRLGVGRTELTAAVASAKRSLAALLAPLLDGTLRDATTSNDVLTVLAGSPARTLLGFVADEGADLVVLGPHARRDGIDFGGVTRVLLAVPHCAVWIQPCAAAEIRRILVPVDLSSGSREALDVATALATRLGAEICVLHCFVPPAFGYPGEPSYVVDHLRATSQQELDAFAGESRAVPATAVLVDGDPVEEILARQEQADLIVLATHGHTGVSAAVLGSVAYAVLRRATVPVLAIPPRGARR